ncbi:MAG: hypothetical protein JW967_11585 [Dehalococcoidales bacterium]|nr:hypothetical protein [Dehalococcoidales bacterium]
MLNKTTIHVHSSSENEQARVMYTTAKLLGELNLLKKDPYSVVIERADRKPIYPCGKSKSTGALNLNHLEFMEEKGQFYFTKPITSFNVILNKGNRQIEIKFD